MVVVERTSITKKIAKAAAATSGVALFTPGGAIETVNGLQVELLDEDVDDYTLGFTCVHDNAGGGAALVYNHSEFTVTRGAAVAQDQVVDTTPGVTQAVFRFLINTVGDVDHYLLVIVSLAS